MDPRGAIVTGSKTAYEAQYLRVARSGLKGRAMSVSTANGSVTVTPQDAEGAWLIALEGEHDLSTAAPREQETSCLWQRCTLAVVDLSDVAFIDTTVINWLVSAKRMLEASAGGAMGIFEGPPARSRRDCSTCSACAMCSPAIRRDKTPSNSARRRRSWWPRAGPRSLHSARVLAEFDAIRDITSNVRSAKLAV
jgi:hypothetical protein